MTLKKIFVLNILEKFDMENDISSKKKSRMNAVHVEIGKSSTQNLKAKSLALPQ